MSIDKREKIQNFAKRMCLQRRLKEKSIRQEQCAKFDQLIFEDLCFLNIETSIAILIEARQAGLTKFTNSAPRQKWQHKIYTSRFDEFFNKLETQTQKTENGYGYLFLYDWELTGALIFSSDVFYKNLSDILYSCEDSLSYYSSDLSTALLINGDRSGSGDVLNNLEISALGQNYEI